VPSAPIKTDESLKSGWHPQRAGNGELPAPAPPSQPLDRGAGAGISFLEAEAGEVEEGEDGAEGKSEVGSWRGRLTDRDRELVSHLGLVRYLRTDQIAELIFPGRAQSVISGRLGELSERHGCSQDIADSSDKGQMLTIDEMEVPLFGFTAMESGADRTESASLMLTISTRPRSTSWK